MAKNQATRLANIKRDVEAKNMTLNWDKKVIEL
jgi:hypothetical protein